MIHLDSTISRFRARGCVIIAFKTSGCMEHDHTFQWIGKITQFIGEGSDIKAEVAVLKSKDRPEDIRDVNFDSVVVRARHIQQLVSGIYIAYLP